MDSLDRNQESNMPNQEDPEQPNLLDRVQDGDGLEPNIPLAIGTHAPSRSPQQLQTDNKAMRRDKASVLTAKLLAIIEQGKQTIGCNTMAIKDFHFSSELLDKFSPTEWYNGTFRLLRATSNIPRGWAVTMGDDRLPISKDTMNIIIIHKLLDSHWVTFHADIELHHLTCYDSVPNDNNSNFDTASSYKTKVVDALNNIGRHETSDDWIFFN